MGKSKYYFTNRDTWNGGFYELALEMGERSDAQLAAALQKLWSYPLLDGCYLNRDKEPHAQPRVQPSLSIAEEQHLRGVAQLSEGHRVACGTFLVRETDGPDWLGFFIPMGSLAEVYDVGGYPFDVHTRSHKRWQLEVDRWMADLGLYIYSKVPYRLGLIGHDVSGDVYAEQLVKQGIPEDRYIGYLWPQAGSIHYYAMNLQWGETRNSRMMAERVDST